MSTDTRTSILIVEDNDAVRAALAPWLSALFPSVRVDSVRTAREGISAVRRTAPRVVVLDLRMPSIDGIEATRRIKARAPLTSVVIFTLCDAQAYRAAAEAAGASDYVLKHRSHLELEPALRRILDGTAPALACGRTATLSA